MEEKKKNSSYKRKMTPAQRKAKRRRQIILFVVEVLALLLLVVLFWGVTQYKKIGKVTFAEGDITINEEVAEAVETGEMKGYKNIACFAVDNTEGNLTGNTRTDVMIIASINLDTKEVKLVSVLRDSYLNIGTDSYRKANAAYAYGGAKQAISMLNMNLDLNITDFVTVGFKGLMDAVDAVGGIEVNVTEEEIVHLNSYQISIVGHKDGTLNAAGEPNYVAEPYVEYTPVTQAGLQKLNGLQATAYCRIRYVGNDYARTARQRLVIEKILEKAKTLNPSVIDGLCRTIFPEIMTSLDLSEIISLAGDATSFSIGESLQFPIADHFFSGMVGSQSCIVPTSLEDNVVLLHQFLFDEEDYTPSETVKSISEKIRANTGH